MHISLSRGDIGAIQAWKATVVEALAVFIFVFIGAGAVIVTGRLDLGGAMTSDRLLVIALAHGLTIGILVAATARISGGHINPAVTFAAVLTGRIGAVRGGMYVAGQLVGAVLAAYLLKATILGAGSLGAHSMGSMVNGIGGGVIVEMVLTFVLVFVIFATAMDPKGPRSLAPFAIGLVVLVDHLVAVPLTGASMNPARSFGPALASGAWVDHWVYWVGPLVGGAIAALLYQNIFLESGKEEAKTN